MRRGVVRLAARSLLLLAAVAGLGDGGVVHGAVIEHGVHAGASWPLPSRGCEPAAVFTQAAVEHSVRALVAAADSFSPFEHLYVRDVFHRDVYACMMHLLPPAEAYTRSHHLSNLHEDGPDIPVRYQTRIRVPPRIGPKEISVAKDYMNATARAFWGAWERHYGAHGDFSAALMERFRGALTDRTPRFAEQDLFVSTDFFQWDTPGTAFEPHSELRDQWLTFIFFLPVGYSHDDMATRLLAPRDDKLAWIREQQASDTHFGGMHPPMDVFYPVDAYPQAKFLPNSMVSFVPCLDSWHSVIPASADRHTISGCIGTWPDNNVRKTFCRRQPTVEQLGFERVARDSWLEEWLRKAARRGEADWALAADESAEDETNE